MNVTILGAGAYGLALSKVFLNNRCNVTVWTAVLDEYNNIIKDKCNKLVLPNYIVDDKITLTVDMEKAIRNSELIVIAIPVKFLRNTLFEVKKYYNDSHICIASKGIEQDSCLFPYDMTKKILKTHKVGVISGGTFAVDIVNDVPIGMTVASKNKNTIKIIEKALCNEIIKLDFSSDVLGTELWGSIKNIMAIGCGIIDGMNYPESTKSLFFTRCFTDITNLVYRFGGNKGSAVTYAGIGDLFLTCTSVKSRNYSFGRIIGSGSSKNLVNKYLRETTVEGYYTLKSFYKLTRKRKKRSKIIDILYSIIYNDGNLDLINDFLKIK